MKKLFILLGLVILSLQVQAFDYFHGTYEEALAKSQQENKLVLLYFAASWCAPCKYMSQNIFTEQGVEYKIRKSYIFLKLDVDEPGVSVPRFYLINHNEEVVRKQESATTLSFFKDFVGVSPEDYQEEVIVEENNERGDGFMSNLFNKWKLGIKAGVNFNNMQTSGLYTRYNGFKTGYNFGIFAERATKYFVFEPGIAFYRKGGKDGKRDASIKLNYIEIPVKMGVNVWHYNAWGRRQPIRLNVAPYASYAISGKVENYQGTKNVRFGNGREELNRFDYGVKVGVSCQFGSFEPSLGYDFGLNNLSNNLDGTSYNRGFYFNLAFVLAR